MKEYHPEGIVNDFIIGQIMESIKVFERNKNGITVMLQRRLFRSPLDDWRIPEDEYDQLHTYGRNAADMFQDLDQLKEMYPDQFKAAVKRLKIDSVDYMEDIERYMRVVTEIHVTDKRRIKRV